MSRQFRSPIQWFGGKYTLAPRLLTLMPPHQTYVEAFGGGASLLLAKEQSPVEVYNDLDSDLVNFFRVLRDPQLFPDFYNRAWLTPYSREEHRFCLEHLNDDSNPAERARRFFVLARWSFSGLIGSTFAFSIAGSRNGIAEKASAFRGVLCALPLICERLAGVAVECRDWRGILDLYDRPETFFYLDPPYVPETRRGGSYRCELSTKDHEDLVGALQAIKGKVMLSGYPSSLYDSLGWRRLDWEVTCAAAGRTRASGILGPGGAAKQKRTECVWMNYDDPSQ